VRVHVKKVLERLREHNLHAKPEKCKFHTSSVEYLGIIITPEGVRMDPKKVQAIIQWPAPRKVKELQSFLLGSVLLSEARMRYSRDSAIVTTGRYEFWSSNAIWNRIGVGGRRRSKGLRVGEGREDRGSARVIV
jgi:hypothetical protein